MQGVEKLGLQSSVKPTMSRLGHTFAEGARQGFVLDVTINIGLSLLMHKWMVLEGDILWEGSGSFS